MRLSDNVKRFLSFEESILKAYNMLLASILKAFSVTGFLVEFARDEASSELNGLFNSDALHGILDEKDNQIVTMVFPFISVFKDKITEYTENEETTKVNCLHSELLVKTFVRCLGN